jgi:MYXO-CTERM domain-containing protein
MKRFFLGLGIAVAVLVSAPSASFATTDGCDGIEAAQIIAADCATINDVGCCEEAMVVWCAVNGDGLCAIDCAEGETTCGWSEDAGFFDCGGVDTVPEGTTMECPEIEVPEGDVVAEQDTYTETDIGNESDALEIEDDTLEPEDDIAMEDDTVELSDVPMADDTTSGTDTTPTEDKKSSSSGCTVGNSSSASVLALLLALFLVPVLRRRYNA